MGRHLRSVEALEAELADTEAQLVQMKRLMSLKELCPEATGPGDACRRLGIDLNEFLEGA